MRDPVERCISAMRMARRQGKLSLSDDESSSLVKVYSTMDYQIRTRYDLTLQNIESVFDRKDIYVNYYEKLFTPSTIREITDFLSIPYVTPDFNKQKNVSRTDNEIDAGVRRMVYDRYRQTYDFIADRYGKEFLSKIWSNYRALAVLVAYMSTVWPVDDVLDMIS